MQKPSITDKEWEDSSVVDCLPGMCQALGSILETKTIKAKIKNYWKVKESLLKEGNQKNRREERA